MILCTTLILCLIARIDAVNHCITRDERGVALSVRYGFRVDFSWLLDRFGNSLRLQLKREVDNELEIVAFEEYLVDPNQFFFAAWSIPPGRYLLTVDSKASCYWSLDPAVSQVFASKRWVSSNETLVLDAGKLTNVYYLWTCEQFYINGSACEAGNDKGQYYVILGEYLLPGEYFTVGVVIESVYGEVSHCLQTIFVENGHVADLIINCKQNCGSTSTDIETLLVIECRNCKSGKYEWGIRSGSGRKIKGFNAIEGMQLTIKNNTLKASKYIVTVLYKGESMGKAEILMNFEKPPEVDICWLEAIEDTFLLRCKVSDRRNLHFELLSSQQSKDLLVLESGSYDFISKQKLQQFLLCNRQLFVKISLASGVFTQIEIPKLSSFQCLLAADTTNLLVSPDILERYARYAEVDTDLGIPPDLSGPAKAEFLLNKGAELAKTLKTGSISRHLESKTNILLVICKDVGKNLKQIPFLRHPIQMDFPDDLYAESSEIKLIFVVIPPTEWSRDESKSHIKLSIFAYKVLKDEQELTTFKHPFTVCFKPTYIPSPFNGTFEVIKGYDLLETHEYNRFVHAFSFNWMPLETISVYFKDMGAGTYFEIVLLFDRYPTGVDFDKNAIIISSSEPSLSMRNPENTERTGYLGLLAKRNNHYENIFLDYELVLHRLKCLSHKNDKWEQDCTPQYYDRLLTCYCNSAPMLLTAVGEWFLPTWSETHSDYFELVLDSQYIIFIVAASLLFIYCILVIFTSMPPQQDINYLADNSMTDRYCYLVIVKTGKQRNSGTTSNVMIQVVGERHTSKPHVLNYPDPEIRLLQRDGEDTFVMTTSKYLGKVQNVEVWYNCEGPSPSWYCREIVVFDMQKRLEWVFIVNTKFIVLEGLDFLRCSQSVKVEKKSMFQRIKIFNMFHTWHFTTRDQENFSNMKRLTIILSNVMSIQALDMIIHGLPAIHLKDTIDFYETFSIDYFTVYSGIFSALISFLVHISIAWTFRFSKIRFSRYSQEHIQLPYKVTLIAWTILAIIIIISTTMLITFGFWVPYYSSLVWLVSSTIALANDVLIYENIFILVRTKTKQIHLAQEIEQHFDQIVQSIERQRYILHKKLGPDLLRPYITHFYNKLTKKELKEKGVLVQKRRSIVEELEDLGLFSIYVILLFTVIFTNRAPFALSVKESLVDILDGRYTHTMPFQEVNSYYSWYTYCLETLFPVIHPTDWYTDYPISNTLKDPNTRMLGIPRIRQHRMKRFGCLIPANMQFLNLPCVPEYDDNYAEQRNFKNSWAHPEHHSRYHGTHTIWNYYTSAETESRADNGFIGWYPKSAYMAYFGLTLNSSMAGLQEMIDDDWVDTLTRAIIIEFLTYNGNYNVFSSVKLLFEVSATGYVKPDINIATERMMYNKSSWDASYIIYICYTIVCSLVFVKQFLHLLRNYSTFYKNAWFMMDLSLNMVSIMCISLFFLRTVLIGQYMKKLEAAKYNDYVSYASLYQIENVMTYLQAYLVTIGTIRMWRYLRFGVIFRVMERTLFLAADGLCGAALGFGLVLIAFGISGIMIFGRDFTEFYSMVAITRTLITMCLKPDQFQITDFIETNIAYLYFSAYLVLMQINMCTFVVVIVIAYTKAQLEFSEEHDNYNIKHYMQDQFKVLPKLIAYRFSRMRGGQDDNQKVTPKADEFMYANSVSTEMTTMQAMIATAKCCFKNLNQVGARKPLTEDDYRRMLLMSLHLIQPKRVGNVTVFFTGRFEGQEVQLIDEKRIDLVAKMAEFLLTSEGERQVRMGQGANEKLKYCSRILKRNGQIVSNMKQTIRTITVALNKISIT